ncbi:iron ABC transporter permease [Phormidium yuhuli AB48]|uniref:Iron ABC transporter permease n=1 Tax=Phormidium yuhuli AB48 TaxID=2940671 RepID=A0ABY5AMJ7_9CYAN|nr:iron ABC transporter permease [Phormidium yuhuli]USR89576.1 iron ABC transporter permease [Phormidium yuhuli AB48]
MKTIVSLGRRVGVSWSIVLLFLLILYGSLAMGSVEIPAGDLLRIFLGHPPQDPTWTTIVLSFRLPKAVTAMVAGLALSVAGLQMQVLFGNPLAGPFVLGISSGASLGVALVVLLGQVGPWSRVLAASLGAALVLGLVMLIAGKVRNRERLLLLGLMFGYGVNSLVTILLHFSSRERIQAYLTWTFGSFAGIPWERMTLFVGVVLLGLLLALGLAKSLSLLLLGDMAAIGLGLRLQQVQWLTLVSTAILAGTVTAFCGPIAFLGVAVPHLARSLWNTSNLLRLLPAVMLLGAMLALLADWLAQVPGQDIVLPLNAVMAMIGAPIVIHAILQRGGNLG